MAHPTDAFFLSDKVGWAVTLEGTVARTTDGGETWRSVGVLPLAGAVSIWAESTELARVVTAGGDVLETTDGGRSWAQLNHYRVFPAPVWSAAALLSLVVTGILAVVAYRMAFAVTAREDSIEDSGVADRPLRPGDADLLDHTPLAQALSGFLRHQKTEPPLVVAVSGDWGTGKSSLMSLLKGDLEKRGFCPVWFNAWHHQTESHLLASLLESIRRDGVPSWFRPVGWAFRAKLVLGRARRRVPEVFALLLLMSFATVICCREPEAVKKVLRAYDEAIAAKGALTTGWLLLLSASRALPFLAFASPFFLALAALQRGLKAFGVSPAETLGRVVVGARVKDLEKTTSFRSRFAEEFREVTNALLPRRMVIFIDDLDRCRPENVLLVLESVNFLTTSGDCHVVLGMARDKVERAVGLGFKGVAEAFYDDNASPEEKQRRYATQYMQKLVGIEIAVPTATSQQLARFLDASASGKPDRDAAPAKETRPAQPADSRAIGRQAMATEVELDAWAARIDRAVDALRRYATPVIAVTLAVSLGYFGAPLAAKYVNALTSPEQITASPSPLPPKTNPPGQPVLLPAPDDDARSFSARPQEKAVELRPGEAPDMNYALVWVLAGGLFAILVAFGVSVAGLPDVVVHDSPAFKKAVAVWSLVLKDRLTTGREMKRLLNRMRLFAMTSRDLSSEQTAGERVVTATSRVALRFGRLLRWCHVAVSRRVAPLLGCGGREVCLTGGTMTASADETTAQLVREDVIVALTVVETVAPEFLNKYWDSLVAPPGEWSAEARRPIVDARDESLEALTLRILSTKDAHRAALGSWPDRPSLEVAREQFRRMSAAVRSH
jgi:hypothetical protein